jgi:uncharacterized membrane protein YeiH
VPAVLRIEVRAVAALAGAVVLRLTLRWPAVTLGSAMGIGAVTTFTIRVAAAAGDWNLPVPGRSPGARAAR